MHTLNPPKFLSLHLFGIGKLKRTLFLRKICKNIFCPLAEWFILLVKKILSLIWNSSAKTQPVFKKYLKDFFKRIFISKTSLHLFPLGEEIWG